MQFFKKHKQAFNRIVLVLFAVANSGFSVVLYHCSMTRCPMAEESSRMACCAGNDQCSCGMCDELRVPPPPGGDVLKMVAECRTATLAGGVLAEPTIVEKVFSQRHIVRSDLSLLVARETAFSPRIKLTSFQPDSPSSSVPTSSVEKYVLNSTFLI
jgi:hypothetical protein